MLVTSLLYHKRLSQSGGSNKSLLIFAAGAALVPASAFAQVDPYLAVEVGALASSDPFLLSGGGNGAVMFEAAINPSIEITTDRGSSIVASGTLRQRNYSRKYGDFTLGEADLAANYRDSEYLTLGVVGRFERALSFDATTLGVEAAIDPGAIRQSWAAGALVEWRPTEHQLITPEFRFEKMDFLGTQLLVPSSSYILGVGYSVQTGPRTRLGLRFRDIIRSSETMSDMNTMALYGTIARRLGERSSISAELGVERTGIQRERIGDVITQRPARTLLAGTVRLCREAEAPRAEESRAETSSSPSSQWFGCLSGGLNTEVTGLGGLRRDTTVSATVSKPILENFTLRGEGEYRRSSMVGGTYVSVPDFGYGARAEIIRTSVDLDWRVHQDVTMTGRVQYSRRQILTGDRVGATFFGLQLRYSPGSFR